jgi:hypothetical protein
MQETNNIKILTLILLWVSAEKRKQITKRRRRETLINKKRKNKKIREEKDILSTCG